jgi:hypothetical protein
MVVVVFRAELKNFSDPAVSADLGQQRVQDARRRYEACVANARTRIADPMPSDQDEAEAVDQRA